MIEHRYIRQIDDQEWQWRRADEHGQWLDREIRVGDFAQFVASITQPTTPIHIIIAGEDCVTTGVDTQGLNKKHLAKLLPYELEDQIAAPVEQVHMVFSADGEQRMLSHYVDQRVMDETLAPYLENNLEVVEILPDYRFVAQKDTGLRIVAEENRVMVSNGADIGFSADAQMAPMLFNKLAHAQPDFTRITLTAANDESIKVLQAQLPEQWQTQCDIEQQEGHFWSHLQLGATPKSLNLRRGRFAKQLPIGRWFKWWQVPVGVAAVAFVFSIGLLFLEASSNKSQIQAIRAQVQTVYLDAVPGGRKGDELMRLQNLVAKNKGTGEEPTNLMPILSGMSSVIKQMKTVKLANFRYNGDQRQLQINIEVANLAEFNEFKDKLTGVGLVVSAPRSSSQGDIYQARMTLKEAQ